jgi:hypothetical protein
VCEQKINQCQSNPCFNNAVCQELIDKVGFICYCPAGYTGLLCDTAINYCTGKICKNGGTCVQQPPTGFACNCPSGFTGFVCSIQID